MLPFLTGNFPKNRKNLSKGGIYLVGRHPFMGTVNKDFLIMAILCDV